jgi:excisionase family DNA binding protein
MGRATRTPRRTLRRHPPGSIHREVIQAADFGREVLQWHDSLRNLKAGRLLELPTKLLTITQAAALLGVNQKTLRSWADKGLVPVTRLPSGYRRFSPEQLEAIRRRMVGDPEPPGAG